MSTRVHHLPRYPMSRLHSLKYSLCCAKLYNLALDGFLFMLFCIQSKPVFREIECNTNHQGRDHKSECANRKGGRQETDTEGV